MFSRYKKSAVEVAPVAKAPAAKAEAPANSPGPAKALRLSLIHI